MLVFGGLVQAVHAFGVRVREGFFLLVSSQSHVRLCKRRGTRVACTSLGCSR